MSEEKYELFAENWRGNHQTADITLIHSLLFVRYQNQQFHISVK